MPNRTNNFIEAYVISKYNEWVPTLAKALEARDRATWEHSVRVKTYAIGLGRRIGLSREDLMTLRLGALLHDIGKIGVKDGILLKIGTLTEEEYIEIKKHPKIGVEILNKSKIGHAILPIILHHHERYDGEGYPYGLAGQNIPLLARIVCIGDAFEAMTANRLYRSAKPIRMALEEIRSELGSQFDPMLGQTFINMIEGLNLRRQVVSAVYTELFLADLEEVSV